MQLIALALLAACEEAPREEGPEPVEDSAPPTGAADTGSPPGCPTPLSVEPGTGLTEHTPLSDGDPLPIVTGPAGLWYGEVSGAVTGVGKVITIDTELYWPAGEMDVSGCDCAVPVGLVGYDETACTGSFWAHQALICPVDAGMSWKDFVCSLMGEELELTVHVSDYETHEAASATVRVIAVADPTTDCG